jgi:hypothetical protein
VLEGKSCAHQVVSHAVDIQAKPLAQTSAVSQKEFWDEELRTRSIPLATKMLKAFPFCFDQEVANHIPLLLNPIYISVFHSC